MTGVRCTKCSRVWDAQQQPTCPPCLEARLLSEPNLLRAKHDPSVLPSSQRGFRSVVSLDFVQDPPLFLSAACASGAWYINQVPKHSGKPFLFNSGPYHTFAGSGIPHLAPMPTHGLAGLLIPDPLSDPHVYAADPADVTAGEARGDYVRLAHCTVKPCSNLAYPSEVLCVVHRTPQLAVEHPHGP